jgi:hypothetical protein
MSTRVPLDATLRKLVALWAAGFIIIFCLVFSQTVMNTYGSETEKAFAWLFAHTLPTLSLAIAACIAVEKKKLRRTSSRVLSAVAVWGSVAYLLIMLSTLLVRPFTGRSPADWISMSGVWLAPLQGVLAGSLGFFLTPDPD